MHIIKVRCDNSKSFRYSVLLYLYYYNMKTYKFQNYNKHINLLINNVLGKPIFLSRNNGPVKVVIVDMIDRYGIIKA